MSKLWTEEEDTILREKYPTDGGVIVGLLLSRTPHAVHHRARVSGVKKLEKNPIQAGQVFGRLTTIEPLLRKRNASSSSRETFWVCLCTCNTRVTVRSTSLKLGESRSCGCLMLEKATERMLLLRAPGGKCYTTPRPYEVAFGYFFRAYRKGAEKRHISFELSREQVAVLIVQNCHYCGDPPGNSYSKKYPNVKFTGLDRKNNELYYRIENTLPACTRCNFAKNTMMYDEFILWMNRAAQYRKDITLLPGPVLENYNDQLFQL